MNNPQWNDLLEGYFGVSLAGDKQDLWWNELKADIKSLTNDELCNVLRWQSRRDIDRRMRPSLKDVRIWVYCYRKEGRGAAYGESTDSRRGFINAAKAQIRQCRSNAEMWEIICDPEAHIRGCEFIATLPENQELERFAGMNCGFERPPFEGIAGMVSDLETHMDGKPPKPKERE